MNEFLLFRKKKTHLTTFYVYYYVGLKRDSSAATLDQRTSMQEKSRSTSVVKKSDTRKLRVVLAIEFEPGCPLADPPENVSGVELQLEEHGCQTDFIVSSNQPGGGYEVQHEVRQKAERPEDFDDCVCCIFRDYDCVPHILETTGESTYVATYLQDRETGSDLIADLREVCPSVRLVQITDNDRKIVSQIKEVDLASLSDKQKEALEMATDAKYFEPGNGGTLHDLADRLDISSSALSQRISRAEAEILKQLFG